MVISRDEEANHRSRILLAALNFAIAILASNTLAAEQWTILNRDEDAFHARIGLISEAEREISIACYNTELGAVTSHLVNLLAHRVGEGVRVRMLVDGIPSRKMLDVLALYAGSGLDVKVYHPLGQLRADRVNRRLHSKLMLCDDHAMIVGSRNLTDPHFGRSCKNFIDTDILIRGPLCSCGREYFDWCWNYEGAVPIAEIYPKRRSCEREQPTAIDRPNFQFDCRSNGDDLFDLFEPDCWNCDDLVENSGVFLEDSACPFGSEVVVCSGESCSSGIRLIVDEDFRKSGQSMARQLLARIEAATHEILIETPYPAFSHQLKQALVRAARRGVSVSLFTNSIASTDQPTTYAALLNQKASLLRAGVQIFEFGGRDSLHAKGLIIDRCVAWVGSYNFDARGDRLNLELCLQVTDLEFVHALEQSIRLRNQASNRQSLRDAYRLTVGTPAKDRLKVRSLQVITPLIRKSL
jgi:cardiolipin synthase C